MRVEFSLSIGLSGCKRKEIVKIPDEAVEGMSEGELTAYLDTEWREWTYNFIDGNYEIIEEED